MAIRTVDNITHASILKKAIDATVKAIKDNTAVKLPKPTEHYSILVTGFSTMAWDGLKPIE